jgi:N-acetylglucosamine-6-phosphate deacetylase
MDSFTLAGATIHTGDEVIRGGTIIVTDGIVEYVGSRLISGPSIDLTGFTITSGFIDTQVNGGGDVLFNDAPTAETLLKITDAHAKFGTTQLMPTYITGPDMDGALSLLCAMCKQYQIVVSVSILKAQRSQSSACMTPPMCSPDFLSISWMLKSRP